MGNKLKRGAVLLGLMLAMGGASAWAQNNTGFPSGTKCGDLQEPRRSACRDAFDPRPNPREVINKPPEKALLPKKPAPLGQPVPQFNPKSQLNSVPPPLPKVPSP